MKLRGKDPNKGGEIDDFRSITLLNAELKLLAKVLAKILAQVVGGFVEAQTCAIPGRSIHNYFHFLCYTLEKVNRIPDKGGAMVYLNHKSVR